MTSTKRAWSGQGHLPLNTIHDLSARYAGEVCCRLSNGSSRLLCSSLGVDDDAPVEDAVNLPRWMLHALNLPNGGAVTYEVIHESSVSSLSHVEVELVSPFPRVLVPSKKRSSVPQVIRDNKLSFEKAVVRQVTHAAKDHFFSIEIMGQLYIGHVVAALDESRHPVAMGVVTTSTTVFLHVDHPSPSKDEATNDWKAAWDAHPWPERMLTSGLAGYDALVDQIAFHLRLALSLDQPSIASRGFLVQGVGGVGKSLLLQALRGQLNALHVPVVFADGHTLRLEADTSTAFPSTSAFLAHCVRSLDTSSSGHEHGVLLLDNVEALVEEDGNITALGRSFLQLLDKWTEEGRPLAVVATASMKPLPTSITRTGRLERQFHMEVPTEAMRTAIADRLLGNSALAAALAGATGGYVGKDLTKIVRHATAMAKLNGVAAPTWLELLKAQGTTAPSQLQDLNVQRPDIETSWNQFAGYDALKSRLVELLSYRFDQKHTFERLGVQSVSGILLYGPSGCGKTMLVRGLAAVSKANFVQVQSSKLVSKYFGETEKSIRELFGTSGSTSWGNVIEVVMCLARARSSAPCILFFDELDSIAAKRGFSKDGGADSGATGVYARVLSTLLNEMDGVGGQGDIVVVAATNRADSLDAALVRPGRMDQMLEVGFPSPSDRLAIFHQYTKAMPLAPDVDLDAVASWTANDATVTGAMINAICKDAAFRALRESEAATGVAQRHFSQAMADYLRP